MARKRCCSRKAQQICAGVTVGLGVLVLIAGLAIYFTMDKIIELAVDQQVPLLPDSWSTTVWMDPKFDVQMAFWFFNFTNIKEFLAGTDPKPNLVQVGPYIFREVQSKSVIYPHWSSDNEKIFYYNNKSYTYLKGESLDDVIWHLNVPLITVIDMIDSISALSNHPIIENILASLVAYVDKAEGDVQHTVREFLYDGYDDELFGLYANLTRFCKYEILNDICQNLPQVPAKMGFFYGKNYAADGTYFIDSGKDDVSKVGLILEWNGKPELNFWHTHETNMLNGTDGTLNPPFIKTHDDSGNPTRLPLFVSDICRSLFVQYEGDTSVAVDSKRTIPGYLFTVPAVVFSATVPANQGFCVPTMKFFDSSPKCNDTRCIGSTDSSKQYCLPDGMLDLSSCQFGAPIVVTSPHFMFCPQDVFDSVNGLVQDDADHVTSIIIEPTVGIGMYFARKLQLNVALKKTSKKNVLSGFGPFGKIPSAKIIPVLWLNESGTMDYGTGDELYKQVIGQQQLLLILTYVLMGVGPLMVLLSGGFLGYRGYKQKLGAKDRL